MKTISNLGGSTRMRELRMSSRNRTGEAARKMRSALVREAVEPVADALERHRRKYVG